MAAITRLGAWGQGTSRYAPSAPAVGHPVGRITRLGLYGGGVKRAGSFAGRAPSSLHPVGRITQYVATGHGARRYGSFAGRTATVVPPVVPPIVTGGGGYRPRPFRIPVDPLQAQRLDEDELIVLVIASALPLLH